MKNILSIVVGLLFTLISCNDSVTISKSEYNKLKSITPPKGITFQNDSQADTWSWKVIKCSDGHDYLENQSRNSFVIMHYVECNKCKKK
jgi:hypothetical protein